MSHSIPEQVILVNADDHPIGHAEKLSAHQQGALHRAFSICLLRKAEEQWQTLLQRRALGKYHSSGLWTNTCCSHPSPGETVLIAATRRLQEEMGMQVALEEIGHFIYRATLDHGLTEHELDHVLIGYPEDTPVQPNTTEVMDYTWIALQDLQADLAREPAKYTAWLGGVIDIVVKKLNTSHSTVTDLAKLRG